MLYFVIAAILILVAIPLLFLKHVPKRSYGSKQPETVSLKKFALVPLVLLALVTALFSFNRVDQREVGIETQIGKYTSTLNEGGVHWLAPWSSVTKFDQTLQTVTLTDVSVSFIDGTNVEGVDEIGGGKGLIDATVRWQISKDSEDGAKRLWEKYRTFEAVNTSLVEKSARDTVINVANDYPAATAIISQGELSKKILESMQNELVSYGIIVDSVSIPAIDLDSGTQAAVDKLFTTQQDIKRATNEQTRAEIDAQTTEIREASGALSPAANQRYCLDLVNAWKVAENGALPATFDCSLNGADAGINLNIPTPAPTK